MELSSRKRGDYDIGLVRKRFRTDRLFGNIFRPTGMPSLPVKFRTSPMKQYLLCLWRSPLVQLWLLYKNFKWNKWSFQWNKSETMKSLYECSWANLVKIVTLLVWALVSYKSTYLSDLNGAILQFDAITNWNFGVMSVMVKFLSLSNPLELRSNHFPSWHIQLDGYQ